MGPCLPSFRTPALEQSRSSFCLQVEEELSPTSSRKEVPCRPTFETAESCSDRSGERAPLMEKVRLSSNPERNRRTIELHKVSSPSGRLKSVDSCEITPFAGAGFHPRDSTVRIPSRAPCSREGQARGCSGLTLADYFFQKARGMGLFGGQ